MMNNIFFVLMFTWIGFGIGFVFGMKKAHNIIKKILKENNIEI